VKEKLKFRSLNKDGENNKKLFSIREKSIKILEKSKTSPPSKEDLDKIKKSIYNVECEFIVNGLTLNTIIYSPFIPGNYVSLYLQNFCTNENGIVNSFGKFYFTTSSLIKKIDKKKKDDLEPKKKYIIQTNTNKITLKNSKVFGSSRKLINLQKFLFDDKINVSPNRFFYFLLSCTGYHYIESKIPDDYVDNNNLCLNEVKNYYIHDRDSDNENSKKIIYSDNDSDSCDDLFNEESDKNYSNDEKLNTNDFFNNYNNSNNTNNSWNYSNNNTNNTNNSADGQQCKTN
jgi:hypothetical protein